MLLEQPRRFLEPKRQVHVLHRLSCGTLAEIVDGDHHYAASRRRVVLNADVAEVGVRHGMNIRKLSGGIETNEGLPGIALLIDVEQFLRGTRRIGAEVNGFENAAIDGNQLRGETQLAFF